MQTSPTEVNSFHQDDLDLELRPMPARIAFANEANRRTDDFAARIMRDLFLANSNGNQQNDSTWRFFISFAAACVRNLSPKQYGFLLMVFGGILSYLTKTCATRFDSFQAEKTTNTSESVLTLEGAFYAFFPELVHITSFIMCGIITFILILPLQLAPQILSWLLWLCSTIIYFVELVQKTSASKVHVACGDSFKLPVLWVMIIPAFGFSFIIGLMVFLLVYLSWKFIHKGNPRAAEVSLNGVMSLV